VRAAIDRFTSHVNRQAAEENGRSLEMTADFLTIDIPTFAIGLSDASLATGSDARPCQRGFLFAADGVGAAEWSSHAGAWILEVAIAPP
jgi:hypothetical protein